MNVLSFHSSVAMGHVGNSGAAFTLRRLGHEVWPINTVVLSNHPAHGGFRGRVTPAAELAELVQGLAERGALARCDALLSGYLGAADQGPAILDAVAAVRSVNPRAVLLLDPVIGDGPGSGFGGAGGRVYVKPGIAEFLHDRALGHADIVTPNAFELAFLSDRHFETLMDAVAAARALRARCAPRRPAVVATGLRLRDTGAAILTTLVVDGTGAWRIDAPRLDRPAHGAGDVFAAVLLARTLSGDAAPQAAAHAAAALHGVIARTPADAADLALVEAQDELLHPEHRIDAHEIR